ncbi:MAG: helix-turn-helix transcriptional regulator [Chloroflexi bacterium]|nr:MAG: helix-turn-helix transcriptional regulator [Chloroflexota bacterium]
MQTFKIGDTTATHLEEFTQLIEDLLSLGQTVYQQIHLVGEDICQEVMRATQGSARLLLPYQNSSAEQPVPFTISVSFPVQFRSRNYGRLDIAPDPQRPGSPALPLSVAQLLAHTCGSLLYSLELTAFIEGQCQRLDSQIPLNLTKREREVLELICRGNDQSAIAEQLHIAPATVDTHRKRICEKLGVHSERDIPLAAYRAGLFSILDESVTVINALPT